MKKESEALFIKDLEVSRSGQKIVRGVSLAIARGEVVAVMGPNGSGKSTLANAVMGHPLCRATGKITLDGRDISRLPPDERSRAGLFLSSQHQPDIPGVTLSGMLRAAVNARRAEPVPPLDFRRMLDGKMSEIGFDAALADRPLEGFSGGEKKRAEMLALEVLRPKYAILDETDSGLDIDALKAVADGVNRLRAMGMGVLVITHYSRLLNLLKPNRVNIMIKGRFVKTGGPELVAAIERGGYAQFGG